MSDKTETSYFIEPVPRFNAEEKQQNSDEESNTEDESSVDSSMDTKVKTKYFNDIMEKYGEPQEQVSESYQLETAKMEEQQTKKMEIHLSTTSYYTVTSLEDQTGEEIIGEHANSSESVMELVEDKSSVTLEESDNEYECDSDEYVQDNSRFNSLIYTRQTACVAAFAIAVLMLIELKSFACAMTVLVFALFAGMVYLRFKWSFNEEEKREELIQKMEAIKPCTLRILEQVDDLEEEAINFLGQVHMALVGADWRYILKLLLCIILLLTIGSAFDSVHQAMIGLFAALTIPYLMKRKKENIMKEEEKQLSQLDIPNC
ncbi:Reticulon domain containing protein [Trichuris trichiura]|uniref:Reticulon-like protein n=1 Tax=Trichuris trichiura TaxID=36087 RepID=A0A077Z0X2_TRITR|nr:Reticulon domain containing protein [Trichuris trichiura]